MRRILLILMGIAFATADAAGQWHWVADRYVSNPSGIVLSGAVLPSLIDIDGDQDLDLILSDLGHGLRMFENVGGPEHHQFQEIANYFQGITLEPIIQGELTDFDHDGILEFACGQFAEAWYIEPGLYYYENEGDNVNPIWVAVEGFFDGVNPLSSSPFMADWDSDGDYDLGVVQYSDILVVMNFYENTGTGGDPIWTLAGSEFDAIRQSEFWVVSDPQFYDIDGDEDFDILLTCFIPDGWMFQAIFRNDGDGQLPSFMSFAAYYMGYLSHTDQPMGITAGDLNGDGLWDLVLGSSASRAVLFTQVDQLDGFDFQFTESFGGVCNLNSEGISFADIDSDGDQDLVMPASAYLFPDRAGWWDYCENIGNADSAYFAAGGSILYPFGWMEEFDKFGSLSDLDGDGSKDLTYSYNVQWDSHLGCYLHKSGVWERADSLLPSNLDDYEFPELGDVDNDGDLDLFILNEEIGETQFLENIGTVSHPEWQHNPAWINGLDVRNRSGRFADLNRDGKLDLTLQTPGSLSAYLNVGSATNPQWEPAPVFAEVNRSDPFDFVDYDGDGDQDVAFLVHDVVMFYRNESIVGIDGGNDTPSRFELSLSNYPNPFNSQTVISYTIPIKSDVRLEIYDLTGKQVKTVPLGIQTAGTHQVPWNGSNAASGIYFCRIVAGNNSAAKRLALVK